MRRGIHTRPNGGQTVEWLTPRELLRPLGVFDLDPCAHPDQPWETARRMIAPPQDGLAVPWSGRVWLNPPYGAAIVPWLSRLAEHGNGLALVPSRTEVESWFWPFIWEKADAVLFFRGRLRFHKPDGTRANGAGHGSVLAAYGPQNVVALERSSLRGKLIHLTRRNA